MLRVTISAFAAFLFFLVTHFLYFHYFWPQERINALLWIAVLGFIVFLVFTRTLPAEDWFQSKLRLNNERMKRWIFPTLGALFYAFLFMGYLEFYFTADRSITFRMLMITDKEPGHSITRDRMFMLYDVPGIINRRFDDLAYGGYLEQQGSDYRLTTKGKVILEIYRFTIDYLHLGNSEKAGGPVRP